ncbi:hypothetical protein [Planotetraspora sp. GP83]|uniref:hypothetical protein n=1 Tax=Planotetraspora sp. GP83 TaxID=3156264 RepID=UPI0035118DBA
MSADRLVSARRPPVVTTARCAERLRVELERYGVAADVHEGYGLALASVWIDLVVWTDGRWFRWRSPTGGGPGTTARPRRWPGRSAGRRPAVDPWVAEYNMRRPHQAMGWPAQRSRSRPRPARRRTYCRYRCR